MNTEHECHLTGKRPRHFSGKYHRGHMRCVRAARRREARERDRKEKS